MQVFKTALKVFFKHPSYIFIYIVGLTFMGVFIGMSSAPAPHANFSEERPSIAVIDRDDSTFSQGLVSFLGDRADLVKIEDTRVALQDAVAQNQVSYILIIPQGYGEEFMSDTAKDTKPPKLETVVSYESISGTMMDGLVDKYLDTAHTYVTTGTARTQASAVDLTSNDMKHSAKATVEQLGDSAPLSQQYALYMQFLGYTIILSIALCTAAVQGAFHKPEIHKRDLISPLSSLSMNLQIAAACIVIALIAWGWASLVGLAVFGTSLAGVAPAAVALTILALLVFCTLPLSIGFFMGQITTNELIMNAGANIAGLIMSFLGGLWIPIQLMGSALQALAHFMPTFYYGDAISRCMNLGNITAASLRPVVSDLGIILLFSAAVFAVGLVVGRLRIQSADAGGNAVASRSVTVGS